ncbi:Actin-related protein 5 [Pseudolycoriella hygida]|uniref:Actin-related protein 5 n=1 Tax=Pseudolycoriella hygida TaxID=35572 RepID=A0A9Q0SA66_9DIPT|nr:Actin-related protein 5 [Pseudolycoriella hygida]
MNIIELKDLKPIPDIVHLYTPSIKENHVPLIIDNGSYSCRVGWACSDQPQLIFRNLIAKPRKDRNKKDKDELPIIQIGNDIANIELRFQLKSQFDRNVVTHFHNQEQIFDYIFQHLAIEGEGRVPHPIVLTECFANPNYCRQLMSELLFECYDVPSICYGIDSLFALKHNNIGENGLIISCGYHTTHVIPVLYHQIISQKVRRINLGGFHIIAFLHRLLQLKYPVHINAITLSRVEWLLHNHCSFALDYIDELKKWSSVTFYDENVRKIQLPYNTPVAVTTLTAEQKFEKKRELAKRLADINARKREEKLAEDEDQLQKLLMVKDLFDDGDYEEFNEALNEQSIPSYDELQKLIQLTTSKIDKTRQRIAQAELTTAQVFPFEEKPSTSVPQPPADVPLDEWISQTKQKRLSILERKQSRRQRKQDLAKRRTAAAQERMRIISQLARKEKGTDDFGIRDEDWDVYKTISKETGDSDSEAENEKILECEEILRHHDPEFEEPQIAQGGAAEFHQLHIGVESIRAAELLFQPSMIGSSEAGLAETIDYVLKMFNETDQLLLANSVFLTGGCSNFKGLKERLSRELLEMRPFESTHRIFTSSNASLDAWFGAKDVANSTNLDDYLTTKSDYMEKGGEYLKEHPCSNNYHQTPAPIVVETTE